MPNGAAVGDPRHRARRDGTGALVYRDFRELKLAGLLYCEPSSRGQHVRILFAVGPLTGAGQRSCKRSNCTLD